MDGVLAEATFLGRYSKTKEGALGLVVIDAIVVLFERSFVESN